MYQKTKILTTIIFITIMAILTSCDDNSTEPEVSKPVISELEVGIGNSKVAYIGSDLHIEAEIVAEGTIDIIYVEIHKEDGSGSEINEEFTDYEGLKNTTLHKHVDIPSETIAGTYHFHLTVRDESGNETTVEEEITIAEIEDTEAPSITVSSSPANGQSFANGESISISGTVTDNVSLSGMLIALVYESDNIADTEVAGNNTSVIVMLHTHDFDSDDSHSFSASIAVGAEYDNNMTPAKISGDNAWRSGNYYILVKSKDAKSNWAYTQHYPVVVNL